MRKIIKFFKLNGQERKLLIEALYFLFVSQLMIKLVPFRKISKILGKPEKEEYIVAKKEDNPEVCRELEQISKIIRLAANGIFWDSKCLARAIAAKRLLKRRKISSTVFLGIVDGEEKKLLAHAWISSGGIIITGEKGIENYRVITIFTDE